MKNLGQYSLFLIVGLGIQLCSDLIQSTALIEFLRDNVIMLMPTVFAINLTAHAFLLQAIVTDTQKHGKERFKNMKRMLNQSVVEQFFFLLLAIVCINLLGSTMLMESHVNARYIVQSVLLATFIGTLWCLFDTARAMHLFSDFQ